MDKARFLKVYANLPMNIRNDIVLVLDEKPFTWNAVYLEIDNETKLGAEMFEKLVSLEII
ncbi:MAG: hypothetical protein HQ536_00135 [Parcubacteria group bacterium]|nr:hypothetical protein [Parcubacteria group bacterium]